MVHLLIDPLLVCVCFIFDIGVFYVWFYYMTMIVNGFPCSMYGKLGCSDHMVYYIALRVKVIMKMHANIYL